MTSKFTSAGLNRRAFLTSLAMAGGAAALGPQAFAQGARPSLAQWRDKIGLQLFTVRDRFVKDYAGTMKAVAGIGFPEVQSTISYAGLSLDQVKRIWDENHLVSPATHVSPPNGPEFEPTLDAYARIGHKYTTVNTGPPRAAPPPTAPGAAPAPRPPQLPPKAETLESVKRTAAELNAAGAITKKHGLKVIVHNHTIEFEPLADSPSQTPYDILIAETDPDLVALELDIGWATAAGANALDLFKRAPGRFEVWHVKDMANLAGLAGLSPMARQRVAKIVPLGQGDIDYRPIFAAAGQAGMKHFFIEQDTAPDSGDSLAAAATNYRYLRSIFV
jgi:sugar phosphate isomerase/epimerase